MNLLCQKCLDFRSGTELVYRKQLPEELELMYMNVKSNIDTSRYRVISLQNM